MTLRSATALSRTRVSETSRLGSWVMARVTLRLRDEGECDLKVMCEDKLIDKGGG